MCVAHIYMGFSLSNYTNVSQTEKDNSTRKIHILIFYYALSTLQYNTKETCHMY